MFLYPFHHTQADGRYQVSHYIWGYLLLELSNYLFRSHCLFLVLHRIPNSDGEHVHTMRRVLRVLVLQLLRFLEKIQLVKF